MLDAMCDPMRSFKLFAKENFGGGVLDHVIFVTMTTDQLCNGRQHAGRECDQEHHS